MSEISSVERTADTTAVIVVNYASSSLLRENLAPLSREDPNLLVVVVDNFSDCAERRALGDLARAEGWALVCLPDNRGFGAGANAGAARAAGMGVGAFLILNPDARISASHVRRLRARVDAEPATLVSPVVLKPSGDPWFTGSDLYLDTGQVAASRHRSKYPGRRHTQWLSGACLMIHAEFWHKLGGFDEEYFLYWEDIDLSWRATAAGAVLLVDSKALAVHDVGGTQRPERHNHGGRGKSTLYYRYNARNRLLFAARNLTDDELRRWLRSTYPQAWAVLMRGGRRQLVHPVAPLRALLLGIWEGRRIARTAMAVRRSASRTT
ncbi:glycosyltransferase family 2 protein [Arthrobacter zhaoxinii]|uniref:glycosyltransferase family 2 protein n=1 Tax=Arthrobacter zhaoxinii TaxID=2964616 RepID=UPI002101E7ED|nr:glycosyltransferase [Arthrobacter zhaoxinii]MCQ2001761.1 glycosyltransferase [Arthrobacter zhaoxinii]